MKFPKHVWADYNPAAPRGSKWAFYPTRTEQRGCRPDLKPIRLRLAIVDVEKGSATGDLFFSASQDASEWGSALNAASWELIAAYRQNMREQESAKFFNLGKSILRQCILKFLSEVESNHRKLSTKGGA